MGLIKKWFLREDGTIATTKIGGWLVSLSLAIIAVCALPLHAIHIPVVVSDIGMIAGALGAFIGGGTAVAGMRDAVSNPEAGKIQNVGVPNIQKTGA